MEDDEDIDLDLLLKELAEPEEELEEELNSKSTVMKNRNISVHILKN